MANLRILYAEDDRAIRDSVVRALELEGYDVRAVGDGAQLMELVAEFDPQVIVVDVMMPYMDGLTACRRLRASGNHTPVLMLTARTETTDRISGLDAGADAYLAKPFDVEEFLAYIRALVRRVTVSAPTDVDVFTIDDLRVDAQARRAWRGGLELDLTKTEFDLLVALARNTGVVLTHSTIYELVWNYDFGPESKTLAVYMSYLRRKVDRDDLPPLLHTVRGVGYTLRSSPQ
jgi:two-component system, OmpR family, response regulator MprA